MYYAHCTVSLSSIHCTVSLSSIHCTVSLSSIHCTVSLSSIHCTVSLSSIHCTVSLSSIHCTMSLSSIHCTVSLSRIHCTVSLSSIQIGCGDNHDSCKDWTEIGLCTDNPGWMLKQCRKSCGVCKCTHLTFYHRYINMGLGTPPPDNPPYVMHT